MLEPMTSADESVVTAQLQRPPRGMIGVAYRCPCGKPAVVVTRPRLPDGTPFPTTYYLTCRYLVAAIARLEAGGGVERWSRLAADDVALARSLAHATEEQRLVRHELAGARREDDVGGSLELGIAGSRSARHLKCLHAHAAFALARPGYELGERILAEIEPLWPPDRCCSDALREGHE